MRFFLGSYWNHQCEAIRNQKEEAMAHVLTQFESAHGNPRLRLGSA